MRQSPSICNPLRSVGLLIIIFLGLVSIIGTDGGSGGGYPSDTDGLYYHRDADGDGYGDPNDTLRATVQPEGYVTDKNDCNDTDPAVHPNASERCIDDIDNNCDGRINEGCVCEDVDGDGYYSRVGCGTAADCDDGDPEINPGMNEICGDGLDNNCDGLTDNICENCTDIDGDGYFAQSGCGREVDCDDADAGINAKAPEICGNDKDDDCDGTVDENCPLLPDTGQTDCYNNYGLISACPAEGLAFHGQDASYAINPPFYTKLDDRGVPLPDDAVAWAMVRDNVTGLIWEVKTDDNSIHDRFRSYTWNFVMDSFVDRLNAERFGGFSDWRMPNVIELLWLVDFGNYAPAINTDYFPYTMKGAYLSFMDSGENPDGSCSVDFLSGRGMYSSQSDASYVRAVRGKQLSSSLADNGDGTVTDNGTGLMWAQATAPAATTWKEALAWCESQVLAGYNDWRLPTIKELASLVNNNTDGQFIDVNNFPDTTSAYYWSSTTSANSPDNAWAVNFTYGMSIRSNKSVLYDVRAVRDGR